MPGISGDRDQNGLNPQEKKLPIVWDPLVRLFHWSLFFFFFLAYLEDDWLSLHGHAGYTVMLLVLFRLIWGVIGTRHARFTDFVTTPAVAIIYLKQLFSRTAERHLGHNPAGTAMILLLLILMIITGFSGMSLFALEGSGPLANTFVASWPGYVLADVHEFFANFTLIAVIVHIVGVLLTSLVHKENLPGTMITGRKRAVPNWSNKSPDKCPDKRHG